MKIGTYIRAKQPDVLDELHEPKNKDKHKKHRRGKRERLSFFDIKNMMEDRHIYKRHMGALRQIK